MPNGTDSLTSRELFTKLLETMDKNQQFQSTIVQALQNTSGKLDALSEQIETLRESLNNKIWLLIAFLIVAIVALVGVKLALPLL